MIQEEKKCDPSQRVIVLTRRLSEALAASAAAPLKLAETRVEMPPRISQELLEKL